MRFEYCYIILSIAVLYFTLVFVTASSTLHKVRSVKMCPPVTESAAFSHEYQPELYLVNQITKVDSRSQPASPSPFSSAPSSPVSHAPVVAA